MGPAPPSTADLDPKLITVPPLQEVTMLPDLKKYELTTLRKHSDETKPQPKPEPEPEHEHDFKSWPDLPFARKSA